MGDVNWVTTFVSAVVALSGLGAGTVAVNLYKTWRDDRRANATDAMGAWKDLTADSRLQIAQLKTEMRELRASTDAKLDAADERERACELKFVRVYDYMRYLAGLCAQKDIVPMAFDPDGSALYQPLPADKPPPRTSP